MKHVHSFTRFVRVLFYRCVWRPVKGVLIFILGLALFVLVWTLVIIVSVFQDDSLLDR